MTHAQLERAVADLQKEVADLKRLVAKYTDAGKMGEMGEIYTKPTRKRK